MKPTHWLEVRVQLRNHHKLNSSALSLKIHRVHLLGHLVSLWLGVLEFAEDGDLWRGSEEKSIRFIASLAELTCEPERFVKVLRLDGWLDGWLVHDWLDYAGKYLYAKYKLAAPELPFSHHLGSVLRPRETLQDNAGAVDDAVSGQDSCCLPRPGRGNGGELGGG